MALEPKTPLSAKSSIESKIEQIKEEVNSMASDEVVKEAKAPEVKEAKTEPKPKSEPKVDIKTVSKEQLEFEAGLTETSIFDEAVVARPLGFGDSLKIKVKRHEYAYRWFNRYGAEGTRYSFAKANGFVNATPDDVEVDNEDFVKDGYIIVGDLILMKMSKSKYLGAIKYNYERAYNLINPKKLSEKQKAKIIEDVAGNNEAKRQSVTKKVGIYVPPINELDSIPDTMK